LGLWHGAVCMGRGVGGDLGDSLPATRNDPASALLTDDDDQLLEPLLGESSRSRLAMQDSAIARARTRARFSFSTVHAARRTSRSISIRDSDDRLTTTEPSTLDKDWEQMNERLAVRCASSRRGRARDLRTFVRARFAGQRPSGKPSNNLRRLPSLSMSDEVETMMTRLYAGRSWSADLVQASRLFAVTCPRGCEPVFVKLPVLISIRGGARHDRSTRAPRARGPPPPRRRGEARARCDSVVDTRPGGGSSL